MTKKRLRVPRPLLALLLVAGAVASAASPAPAQVTITFQPATVSGPPGATLSFVGTITNTDRTTLFLNGFAADFAGAGFLTLDTSPLQSVPVSLASVGSAGSSFTGLLLRAQAAPNAPVGNYAGALTLFGGVDPDAGDALNAPVPFTARVVSSAAAPEPGSFWLLVSISIAGLCRRASSRP